MRERALTQWDYRLYHTILGCPFGWIPLPLFYGVTDYQLSIKGNPDNLDPQDALIGSNGNIQIAHATKYRIEKPELAFKNVKVCFKVSHKNNCKLCYKTNMVIYIHVLISGI